MSGTNLLCENAQQHDPTTLPSVVLFGNNKVGNQPKAGYVFDFPENGMTLALSHLQFQYNGRNSSKIVKRICLFFVPERRGEVGIM